MSVNVSEFSLQLKSFGELAEEQAVQAQRKVTLQILRGVILGNPRDTGRSQNAWIATVGAPSGFVLPPGNYGRPDVMAAGSDLASLKFGQDSWVANNTEYVGHLELRHPDKSGWVAATVANVQSALEVSL